MNWKMTAKTTLVQMHHKIETFEYVNKKLVLVLQDCFLDYMRRNFDFSRLRRNAATGDSMHFHSYSVVRQDDIYRIDLDTRWSTDAEGMSICLGLQAQPYVEYEEIVAVLEQKMSARTIFAPVGFPVERSKE